MSQPQHIGLVCTDGSVTTADLQSTAAAIAHQAAVDFFDIWHWGHPPIVSAFSTKSVPAGVWPVYVQATIDQPDAAGYHSDSNGQPYAIVLSTDTPWSVTASHEILEMLADPWGSTLLPATINGKKVMVLRELCDPCENLTYEINGVQVSDFTTPDYWYGAVKSTGDFLKECNPLQVLNGGYLSWIDETEWFQETWFDGNAPIVTDAGPTGNRPKGANLREYADILARRAKLAAKGK